MEKEWHLNMMRWIDEVAERLRTVPHDSLIVDEKEGAHDLVTEMDRWAEKYLVEKITTHYPTHQIIGEEGTSNPVASSDGYVWIIDPIDGTLNFVKGHNHFGVMVGLFKDGKPLAGYIYDVMREDFYYGIVGVGAYKNEERLNPTLYQEVGDSLIAGNVKNFMHHSNQLQPLADASLGVRAYGSAALHIISVITGETSLYISCGLSPWDFAAGYAICESLGFKVSDLIGQPINILQKSPVIFAHPGVYNEALHLLKEER